MVVSRARVLVNYNCTNYGVGPSILREHFGILWVSILCNYLGTPRTFLGHTLSHKDFRKYNLGYLGHPVLF